MVQHVFMMGVGAVLIALTAAGFYDTPLATLLLIGLLLLCPLMMMGMHGRGHDHGGEQGADGSDQGRLLR
jgi:hypothetical protein